MVKKGRKIILKKKTNRIRKEKTNLPWVLAKTSRKFRSKYPKKNWRKNKLKLRI